MSNFHDDARDERIQIPMGADGTPLMDAECWHSLSPQAQQALSRLQWTRGAMADVMARGRRPDGRRPNALAAFTGTVADMLGARAERQQAYAYQTDDQARRQADDDGRDRTGPADSAARAAPFEFDPRQLWSEFLGRTQRQNVPDAAWSTLAQWWDRQPWRETVEAYVGPLRQEADNRLVPWVRSHPLSSMLVGVAVGAGVVMARPWRWSPLAGFVNRHARPLPRRTWRWAKDFVKQEVGKPAVQALLLSAVAGLLRPSAAPARRAAPTERPDVPPREAAADGMGQSTSAWTTTRPRADAREQPRSAARDGRAHETARASL